MVLLREQGFVPASPASPSYSGQWNRFTDVCLPFCPDCAPGSSVAEGNRDYETGGWDQAPSSPHFITLSKPIGAFCSWLWENQRPHVGDGRLGSLLGSPTDLLFCFRNALSVCDSWQILVDTYLPSGHIISLCPFSSWPSGKAHGGKCFGFF